MNKLDALNGALVADAAALGLHWMYDQQHLQALAATGDVLFRHPEIEIYRDRKAYFAHAALRSGERSHYGASAKMLAEVALADEGYSRAAHAAAFMQYFGPCGEYVGFADRPTKALVAVLLQAADDLPERTGSDDSQMPTLAYVPGLFAAADQPSLSEAVELLSSHSLGLAGAVCVWQTLEALSSGKSMSQALRAGADSVNGELKQKLYQALEISHSYRPLEVAQEFGLACQMLQGLPLSWYLANNASNYESVIRDNVLCGGDSCGRAMALGAIAGFVYGVPVEMQRRANGAPYT